MARPICFSLLRQETASAVSLLRLRTGSSIAARIAMIAITTNNSMSVNAEGWGLFRGEHQRLLSMIPGEVCRAFKATSYEIKGSDASTFYKIVSF